ncbi:response regulator [Chloroflexota bacterium]
MSNIWNKKKILLVEDLEVFYKPITRWLGDEGYDVQVVNDLDQALDILNREVFHLAIVDLRLDDEDENNRDGLELLRYIHKHNINQVMPCIILTAHNEDSSILEAYNNFKIERYILKSPSFRKELIEQVDKTFSDKIEINFFLEFLNGEEVLDKIIEGLDWGGENKPLASQLKQQTIDIICHIYRHAKSVYINLLKPGLTGASILQVKPNWEKGPGPSTIVKINRKDKTSIEVDNFQDHVLRFLYTGSVAQLNYSFTQHLGGIQYTFAGGNSEHMVEFDQYFQEASVDDIIHSLDNLFNNTCNYWYSSRDNQYTYLPQLYYAAFQLDQEKLTRRIQEVLPWYQPYDEFFHLGNEETQFVNPLFWLTKNQGDCVFRVDKCITHGDMTGRNILVDSSRGVSWLIDFYRTYDSHILRDFVVLESDIKFRLMPFIAMDDFIDIEFHMLSNGFEGFEGLDNEIQKGIQIILRLREIGMEFITKPRAPEKDAQKEYFLSLLMTYLNIIRLKHIPENRKLQALIAASMICQKLDYLLERVDTQMFKETTLVEIQQPLSVDIANVSAQVQRLIDLINNQKLTLFIGSKPIDYDTWPSLSKRSQSLMEEIGFDEFNPVRTRMYLGIYENRGGGRDRLIDLVTDYFEGHDIPEFFDLAALVNWKTIFTTNQHTYLEDKQPRLKILFDPAEEIDPAQSDIIVYKIFGSLRENNKGKSPDVLPITEYDLSYTKTREKISVFIGVMKQHISNGYHMLVLNASDNELEQAKRISQTIEGDGLVWIADHRLSDNQQDELRRLGFRVLSDHPEEILKAFNKYQQV